MTDGDDRVGRRGDRSVDVGVGVVDPDEPPPIALRIVVDGASTAGKTTTARALGERLGRPVTTPQEASGRTLLFDWLDHTGGRSEGRAIRTQVVAVPGHLPHLRARLLVTADVVLFVADTSASGLPTTAVALDEVRELLAAMADPRPGLLVQANKRDAPDALPLDEVRRRLRLADDDVLIETVATLGEGVRQSYVYAVRLGLRRVRAEPGPRTAERQLTADDLLAQLDTDPRPIAVVRAEQASAPASDPEGAREPSPARVRPAPPPAAGPGPWVAPARSVTQRFTAPPPAPVPPVPRPEVPAARRSSPSGWRRWFDRG